MLVFFLRWIRNECKRSPRTLLTLVATSGTTAYVCTGASAQTLSAKRKGLFHIIFCVLGDFFPPTRPRL